MNIHTDRAIEDRSMIMNGRVKKKLFSQAGETIAETLIALLVSALALVMLAGAIGTAARIISQSETKMQQYYQANNTLASPGTGEEGKKGTATIGFTKSGGSIKLVDTDSFSVKYTKNDEISSKPVVAYAK